MLLIGTRCLTGGWSRLRRKKQRAKRARRQGQWRERCAKYNGTVERIFDPYKQTVLAKSQQKNVKK